MRNKSFFILLVVLISFIYGCKKEEDITSNKIESYDKVVTAIASYNNTVWVGTSVNGIYRFDGESWTVYKQTDGLVNDTITCLIVSNEGCLWVGTYKGISTFENNICTNITTADGLFNNDIRSLACDSQNNIWIGTRNNRLVKYDGTDFTTYHVNPELSGPAEMGHIHCITFDAEGNVWAGSCISGLSKFDGTIWTHKINKLASFVESSLSTANGNIWVGHYTGAYQFSGNEWTHFAVEDGLASNVINCFTTDQQNNIWIGTDSGLSRYNGESFKNFTIKDGLPDNNIKALACDENNNIWIATGKGLVNLVID
jgi:ligand-binding sensor domain-containing protein